MRSVVKTAATRAGHAHALTTNSCAGVRDKDSHSMGRVARTRPLVGAVSRLKVAADRLPLESLAPLARANDRTRPSLLGSSAEMGCASGTSGGGKGP